MIACLLGTIKSIQNKNLIIEDILTEKEYNCEYVDDQILNLEVGVEGVFVGQFIDSTFRIRKVDLRKFLEPLYEKEIIEASGKYNLVPVLKDPFTETYLEFLEKMKQEELTEEIA